MQKHHIVQNKYLSQWRLAEEENQLNIYSIPENKYLVRGPNWQGFKRRDYNILDKEKGNDNFYLPEKVAEDIDKQGIELIRRIDGNSMKQLGGDGYERSVLAFYIALQYIRTPKFRDEEDKFMEQTIKYFMRKDLSSPDKFRITKDELLKTKPENKKEAEAIKKIESMTEEQIKQEAFNFLHSDDLKIKLTNTGHSKQILKVERLARGIFECSWLFLVAPKNSSFATSDNPCFAISPTKMRQGLLSPNVLVIFPLRPDLCITVKPKIKSKTELFSKPGKKEIRDINRVILENSYQFFITRDFSHLEALTKAYDFNNHRKSRDTKICEHGDYVMFNLE